MSIITATDVRYTGDWNSSEYSDTMLHSAPYITAGDSWLNGVCSTNGYANYAAVTGTDTQNLLRAAECYWVAGAVVSIPPKDDFQAGPVRSFGVGAKDKVSLAEYFEKKVKELLNLAGFYFNKWEYTYSGGADYHPSGYDNTNVDLRYADEETAFDFMGGES